MRRVLFAFTLVVAACAGADTDTASDSAPAGDSAPSESSSEADTATNAADDEVSGAGDAEAGDGEGATDDLPVRSIEHALGSTEIVGTPDRIVALSEEFLLADLLAFGITPVASTSNNEEFFPGIDPALVDGVEVLFTPAFSIEELAGLEPDLILGYPGIFDAIPGGYEIISDLAPTVAVGEDGDDWRAQLRAIGEIFDDPATAEALIAEYEAAYDAAAASLEGQTLSVLAIFSGPFIRAYTTGEHRLMGVAVELGAVLVPSDGDGADAVGRVVISLERLEEMQGDTLILLQSDSTADDEDEAVRVVAESPLWPTLPAVAADRVVTLDRLGYPGAAGRARFATDLAAAVG